jgi:hypothetical protein
MATDLDLQIQLSKAEVASLFWLSGHIEKN